MELKIKLYEKEGKRCCYIEDGKENGQEYGISPWNGLARW